jgi:hypothetical protein
METLNLFVLAGYEVSFSETYIIERNSKILLEGDVSITPVEFLDRALTLIGAEAVVQHVNIHAQWFADNIYEDAWTTPNVEDVFNNVCKIEFLPSWKGKTFKEVGLLTITQQANLKGGFVDDGSDSEHMQNVPL